MCFESLEQFEVEVGDDVTDVQRQPAEREDDSDHHQQKIRLAFPLQRQAPLLLLRRRQRHADGRATARLGRRPGGSRLLLIAAMTAPGRGGVGRVGDGGRRGVALLQSHHSAAQLVADTGVSDGDGDDRK